MIDRLNNLTTEYKPIDYAAFFDVMDIPKEDKEKRIELAEEIDDIFFWLFSYVYLLYRTGQHINVYDLISSVEIRLNDVVNVNIPYVSEHLVKAAKETVEATVSHIDDEYFTSDQRATEIAADEAMTVCNYEELQDAIDAGYTMKTWRTRLDRRVRKSHAAMEDKTIPIEDLFDVDGSEMLAPHDSEHGANLRELAGCRCWCEYS